MEINEENEGGGGNRNRKRRNRIALSILEYLFNEYKYLNNTNMLNKNGKPFKFISDKSALYDFYKQKVNIKKNISLTSGQNENNYSDDKNPFNPKNFKDPKLKINITPGEDPEENIWSKRFASFINGIGIILRYFNININWDDITFLLMNAFSEVTLSVIENFINNKIGLKNYVYNGNNLSIDLVDLIYIIGTMKDYYTYFRDLLSEFELEYFRASMAQHYQWETVNRHVENARIIYNMRNRARAQMMEEELAREEKEQWELEQEKIRLDREEEKRIEEEQKQIYKMRQEGLKKQREEERKKLEKLKEEELKKEYEKKRREKLRIKHLLELNIQKKYKDKQYEILIEKFNKWKLNQIKNNEENREKERKQREIFNMFEFDSELIVPEKILVNEDVDRLKTYFNKKPIYRIKKPVYDTSWNIKYKPSSKYGDIMDFEDYMIQKYKMDREHFWKLEREKRKDLRKQFQNNKNETNTTELNNTEYREFDINKTNTDYNEEDLSMWYSALSFSWKILKGSIKYTIGYLFTWLWERFKKNAVEFKDEIVAIGNILKIGGEQLKEGTYILMGKNLNPNITNETILEEINKLYEKIQEQNNEGDLQISEIGNKMIEWYNGVNWTEWYTYQKETEEWYKEWNNYTVLGLTVGHSYENKWRTKNVTEISDRNKLLVDILGILIQICAKGTDIIEEIINKAINLYGMMFGLNKNRDKTNIWIVMLLSMKLISKNKKWGLLSTVIIGSSLRFYDQYFKQKEIEEFINNNYKELNE